MNDKTTPTTNREYKSTVFAMLFKDRDNLLSLYNALNGSNYDSAEDLEIVALENATYIAMKNDNSFLNESLKESCRILREYTLFVEKVRHKITEDDITTETAIKESIQECIKENILRDFLTANR